MALGDKDSLAIPQGEVYTARSSFITQNSSHSSANLREDSSLKKRRPAFFVKSSTKFNALRLKKAQDGPRLKVDNSLKAAVSIFRSTAIKGKSGLFATTASCIETPDAVDELISPQKFVGSEADETPLVYEEVPLDFFNSSTRFGQGTKYCQSTIVPEEQQRATKPYQSLQRKAPCS